MYKLCITDLEARFLIRDVTKVCGLPVLRNYIKYLSIKEYTPHGIALNPACISNYIPYGLLDEIDFPLPNFKGKPLTTVKIPMTVERMQYTYNHFLI